MNRYLESRYARGGRDYPDLDCWGLTRLARTELFGRPMLPLCSNAQPGDFRAITQACSEVSGVAELAPSQPQPGAIATAWCASLCIHVGLVVDADGRRWVLETDDPTGPCLTPLKRFESRYTRVIYYDD